MSSYYDQVASPGDEIHVNVPPIISFSSFRFRETAGHESACLFIMVSENRISVIMSFWLSLRQSNPETCLYVTKFSGDNQ